ncbi:MAG: DODA-type extradiol aromatic ring-opening family dioxygenase [Xanthobacteraceae bacterium]
MAKIVFGAGCSHSPLLATKPEQWDLRANDDRKNPSHPYRGKVYSFTELEALRKNENLTDQIKMEVRHERDARNQKNLALLKDKIAAANLDVLVVFGDDQREVLMSDNMPGFMVFVGKDVPFKPTSDHRLATMTEGVRVANWARVPEKNMTLPGAADLGKHVVKSVVGDGFDVATSDRFVEKPGAEDGIGHAFGFYYHRLMDDLENFPKLTTLPIFINTFFPPNQPSVQRVLDFGRAVGRAIRSWDSPARVGIAASGGFSHFVIDESLDKKILDAIATGDLNSILEIPESHYQSGTSEIKNWIAAMGALEGSGLNFKLLDYVPCYRSSAGTGNAMAFGLWQAA